MKLKDTFPNGCPEGKAIWYTIFQSETIGGECPTLEEAIEQASQWMMETDPKKSGGRVCVAVNAKTSTGDKLTVIAMDKSEYSINRENGYAKQISCQEQAKALDVNEAKRLTKEANTKKLAIAEKKRMERTASDRDKAKKLFDKEYIKWKDAIREKALNGERSVCEQIITGDVEDVVRDMITKKLLSEGYSRREQYNDGDYNMWGFSW